MSKLRSINTVIWSDPWFEVLEPAAKLLFIYLVTNEKTNMLGVYEISVRKVSFETGITSENIERYLKEFQESSKIKYAENRVLLLNFLKHQNYNFNMMKSAIRTYNKLPKILKVSNINELEETKEGFLTLCNGFSGVRKYEVEVEDETKLELEDEIEYENEITSHTPIIKKDSSEDFTPTQFLERWKDARMYYDKKPTEIKKLLPFELVEFNELKKDYTRLEIERAMTGLFQQSTLPIVRLRPSHFLKRDKFEMYLTCFTTKEKLFEDKKYKKQIDRI